MRKIVALFLMLAIVEACSTKLYAFTPVKSSKQRYNERVMDRLSEQLAATVNYNKTHKNKKYYIKDDEDVRFFYSYFTSPNAGKLFVENLASQANEYGLTNDTYEDLIDKYINALRDKYLPEKYKDYQIYFMVAGLFYTPDVSKTDVSKNLDWTKVRSLSFDNIPATKAAAPYAQDAAKDQSVLKEFSDKVNLAIYDKVSKKKSINIVLTDKTIIIYKWLLFDLDIKDETLEGYLRGTSDIKTLLSNTPPQPVMFMSDGYLYNSKSSVINEISGLNKFLTSDGDYSDMISLDNMALQRNSLMKDLTNAFVYFYQKDKTLIPADFCSRSDDDKEKILDVLASGYVNAPTGNWETTPFRNPVLFLNIDWDTRKCVLDYLLRKSNCTDANGGAIGNHNACENMLIDVIGATKGADQKKVLDYFNDPAAYKKLYERIDDAGGEDNYTGIVFAFCKLSATNGYWDTKTPNDISNALFNFHNTVKNIGAISFEKTEFDASVESATGLHFEISKPQYSYVDDNIGYQPTTPPAEKFDCSPFTPVQFVYSDNLEFVVKKADGTTPMVGEVVTVPALYLQWIIHTDFKMSTIKTGQTILLVSGLLSGVNTLTSATSIGARVWAAADVFFTTAALLSSDVDFKRYIKQKYGDQGLEVLGVINTFGTWFGGAYLGKGALTYLANKMEQKAVQATLRQMVDDVELAKQYRKQADAIDEAAAELDKEGWKMMQNALKKTWRTAEEMRKDVMDWAKAYQDKLPSITQKAKFNKATAASYMKDDGTIETVFGRNGGVLNTEASYPTISAEKNLGLHKDLASRLPADTKWPFTANCAECDAVNQALWNGAKWEKIQIHTIDIRPDGTMSDVIRCSECQDIFKDMYITSE